MSRDLAKAPSNLHLAWARLFLRALADAGVTDAILSPGSRSAPLAIALAAERALRMHVVVDERSASFFALGQARVTGRPTLLVCTSGTAGAHYFPAVIEASQSFVPMLVVTADRPWELYGAAAPQTIDQVKLFGDFVRHYAELGLPEPVPSALRGVRRIAAQAVAKSLGPVPGPVHVNARFRKPLEPVDVSGTEAWEPFVEALLAAPGPVFHAAPAAVDAQLAASIAERIARAERGVLACGPAPLAQGMHRGAILELARRSGFPLVAESTSQIRFGGDRSGVLDAGPVDAILRDPTLGAPDLVIQLGAPPTSSAYASFAAAAGARVVVAEHGWSDADNGASVQIQASPGAFAAAVAERLAPTRQPSAWASGAAERGRVAGALAHALATTGPELSEAAIAHALVASCPADAVLMIGNSTPVRDVDLVCPPSDRALRVLHQRGASGIDGLTSGAAGSATSSGAPTALLLGDLSLLHDLSGLGLLARSDRAMVVVVVQNGGGRIFDQLPVAGRIEPEVFERCFGTPQAVGLARASEAFGVEYARATTIATLDDALARAWERRGPTLIEAVAPPRARARALRDLWADFEGPTTARTRGRS